MLKVSLTFFHLKLSVQPPRQIPNQLQLNLERIIHEMGQNDAIEQHYGLVTWLANLHVASKLDENMTIKIDMTGLNHALDDHDMLALCIHPPVTPPLKRFPAEVA